MVSKSLNEIRKVFISLLDGEDNDDGCEEQEGNFSRYKHNKNKFSESGNKIQFLSVCVALFWMNDSQ